MTVPFIGKIGTVKHLVVDRIPGNQDTEKAFIGKLFRLNDQKFSAAITKPSRPLVSQRDKNLLEKLIEKSGASMAEKYFVNLTEEEHQPYRQSPGNRGIDPN